MPLKTQLREELYNKFTYYSQLHLPQEKIENELQKAGATEEELFFVKNHFAILKAKAKHQRGVIFTAIGSVILIAGFIITAVLFHQNSPLQGVMYGLTALGLVLLIWGLIDIF